MAASRNGAFATDIQFMDNSVIAIAGLCRTVIAVAASVAWFYFVPSIVGLG